MSYKANPVDATTLEELIEHYRNEIRAIEEAFLLAELEVIECKIWYELPPHPVDGLIAYIDSSAHASIVVTGLHEYRSGAWMKL